MDPGVISEVQDVRRNRLSAGNFWSNANGWMYTLYALALAASISIWFLAVRAPLWLDETGTYWMIKDGFSEIWPHQYLGPPVYFYIVWFGTKLIGTSEIALRIPSVLAMLGAVYLLYLAAREIFERDAAMLAVVLFCLNPIVILEAVDVRPYAFAALATNAGILVLLRLRRSDSNWLAALFGLLAAVIVSFHYLFAVILPAFVVCFFILKGGNRKALWRQFGIAAAVFAVAFLPMVPGVLKLFRSSGTHVFEEAPTLSHLLLTLAPGWLSLVFIGTALMALMIAAVAKQAGTPRPSVGKWRTWICAFLGVVPLLILYGVSAATPIHMFTDRHLLVAVPGLSLCWALLAEQCFKIPMRLLFCGALVTVTCGFCYSHPSFRKHGDSWKYAIDFVQRDASSDNAPVVICSDFPEADYVSMPIGSAKSSRYFAQLSYYKLTEPVIPMPRSLNAEAVRVGSQFLQEATEKHQRFFAMAFRPSYPTLDWLTRQAAMNYQVRKLAVLDDIEVLEFRPRIQPRPTSQAR